MDNIFYTSFFKKVVKVIILIIILNFGPAVYAREHQLIDSEMFNKHGSIMLLIDSQTGLIRGANKAAINFYGYSKEELLTMSIDEINQLSSEEIIKERELAKRQERNHFKFIHRLADGSERNVEVYSYPIEDGEEVVLFSIIHDITEQVETAKTLKIRNRLFLIFVILFILVQSNIILKKKRLEKKLSNNKDMLDKILNLSSEAIRYVDKNYNIIKSNDKYRELNKLYLKGNKLSFANLNNTEDNLKCYNFLCSQNCDSKECSLK